MDAKQILHLAKFRYGATAPKMYIYIVPAQETAKHRASLVGSTVVHRWIGTCNVTEELKDGWYG